MEVRNLIQQPTPYFNWVSGSTYYYILLQTVAAREPVVPHLKYDQLFKACPAGAVLVNASLPLTTSLVWPLEKLGGPFAEVTEAQSSR